MTAPNIPAALARLAVDMENLASLIREYFDETVSDRRVTLLAEAGRVRERTQVELTPKRAAALVAEVIAARLQDELWRKIDTGTTDAGDHVAARNALNAARAATDKAFGE